MKPSKFFYGWVITLTAFVSLAIVFGGRLSFQVFFVALIEDFGWSRASTAGIFSISMVIFALTAIPFGWLLDQYGPRVMFSIGAILFAGGMIGSSWITAQWQLYVWYGVVASLGITVLGLSNYVTLIARWFSRRRGTAMGIAFAGTGVGTLVIVPLTEYWITIWGWRWAMVGQGILLLAIVLPSSILFLRIRPSLMGLFPDGNQSPKEQTHTDLKQISVNWSLYEALRTPAFWLLLVASFGALFSMRMLTVHQLAAAVDVGFDRFFAATVMGLSGGIVVVSFIGWGILADQIGRSQAFVISSATMLGAIITLLLIQNASQVGLLYLYAILFGLAEGSRSSLLTAIMSDTFPGNSLGRINGFVGMAFGAGAAAGSWLAGYLFDITGSYAAALWVSLIITLISGGSVGLITLPLFTPRKSSANNSLQTAK